MERSDLFSRGIGAIAGFALIITYPSLCIANFYGAVWDLSSKAGCVEATLAALSRATENGPVACVAEEGEAKAGRPISVRALERMSREALAALRDTFLHGLSDSRIALAFSVLNLKLPMTRGIDKMGRIIGVTNSYLVRSHPVKMFCGEDDGGNDNPGTQQEKRLEEYNRKIADFLASFREASRDYESQKLTIGIVAWPDIALMAAGYGILAGTLVRYVRRKKAASCRGTR